MTTPPCVGKKSLYIIIIIIVSEGGGLVCESVGMADLLSYHFKSSSLGMLPISRSLAIRLLVLPPLPLGRERSGVSC